MRSLYMHEDLLFKVIFDRKYRPQIYNQAIRSKEDDKKELKKQLLNIDPDNLVKDDSYPSLQSFRELEYMEQMSKTRY